MPNHISVRVNKISKKFDIPVITGISNSQLHYFSVQ